MVRIHLIPRWERCSQWQDTRFLQSNVFFSSPHRNMAEVELRLRIAGVRRVMDRLANCKRLKRLTTQARKPKIDSLQVHQVAHTHR